METRTILAQLRSERERLDKAITALESLDGISAAAVKPKVAPGRRRGTMSPAARKRLSEMMKKRWAERRKAKR